MIDAASRRERVSGAQRGATAKAAGRASRAQVQRRADSGRWDLVVIGGGSAGIRAARLAASRGARVALVEVAHLGGTCVNLGCVPKKLLWHAAADRRGAQSAMLEGAMNRRGAMPAVDWPRLRRARSKVIRMLRDVHDQLLRDAGVTVLQGHARVAQPGVVEVRKPRARPDAPAQATLQARRILLATGGEPSRPDIDGAQWAIVSDDVFALAELPRRLVVVGGGFIACELACILSGLGSQVTLVHRGARLLEHLDGDVSRFATEQIANSGVALRLKTQVAQIRPAAHGRERAVLLDDGSRLRADHVLLATGRRPKMEALGLQALGAALDAKGRLVVDAAWQTSIAGIYAVGDLIGRRPHTPVALAEATQFLARNLRGRGPALTEPHLDYEGVATAVFTDPPIGSAGLSEQDAHERHGRLRIYRHDFRTLQTLLGGGTRRTMVKVIVRDRDDRVVGAHVVGDGAAEMIQGFAAAIEAGVTKAGLDRVVGIHPTAAEEFFTLREPVRVVPAGKSASRRAKS